MIKSKKIDYKLANLALIALIVFLMYQTGHLWIDTFNKLIGVITPFVLAFAVAYALYPFVEKLRDKNIPKGICNAIVLVVLAIVLLIIGYIVSHVLIEQLKNLFSSISNFLSELDKMDWDINFDFANLQETVNDNFKNIIASITKYVSDGAMNIINSSISFLGKLFVGSAAFIYFLIDMEKIRLEIKKFFKRRSEKSYKFVRLLDHEMRNYLSGLVQIVLISMVEYSLAYSIIGHPDALLLGFLAGIANLIPYFGGIANNVIASITAFVISPGLFVRTLITFFILSSVDGYLINPFVYGKTNSIHPLIVIFAMFAGSALFGIIGVFISFPVAIILVAAYKYYKEDITEGIEKIKLEKE